MSASPFRVLGHFAVVAAFALATGPVAAAIPAAERAALLDFYAATGGDHWTNRSGWGDAAGRECDWYGVTCDAAGAHVTKLSLGDNHLAGALPASLAALTQLAELWVDRGDFPEGIAVLSSLGSIELFSASDANLSGRIPPLAGLTRLRVLQAPRNDLSGPLPALAGLQQLEFFAVNGNRLSGPIPPLTSLPNLKNFQVSENRLDGAIPSLADLPVLQNIFLRNNELLGPPPPIPTSGTLLVGTMCPNHFDPVPSNDWNRITSTTPWYSGCTPRPDPIYADGFEPRP